MKKFLPLILIIIFLILIVVGLIFINKRQQIGGKAAPSNWRQCATAFKNCGGITRCCSGLVCKSGMCQKLGIERNQ